MITEEEKVEIIDRATEKALLAIPEVVGNLMVQHISLSKINKKFYADYPEFKGHKDAVMAVVETVEGENPLLEYEDLLKKAVPKIRERISAIKPLDMINVPKNPDRDFKRLDTPGSQHGEI